MFNKELIRHLKEELAREDERMNTLLKELTAQRVHIEKLTDMILKMKTTDPIAEAIKSVTSGAELPQGNDNNGGFDF